ncbi:hypothetical protein [Streptomyces sp. WM6386]|uniref:hypothetical protein n=1 Tax=Streptomyces sp. WM6386 TaxID=1415558 RepID=UPI001901B68F|nr:hypothetical protein [Streptomyces sp. WM6386]
MLRQLHHGKRTVPGALLTSERADGDSLGALLRYAAWRPPWSLRLVLRYVSLRRSLLYAAASAPPEDTEELRRVVAGITARMDASDNQHTWQTLDIRAWLKTARRDRRSRERWLLLIPCVLMLPALLFLVVGSFTSTAGLQEFFSTGAGPKILMGFGIAALAWIAYQLTTLLRTWRLASAQPLGEALAAHRFRLGTALGAATTGVLLLWARAGRRGPRWQSHPHAPPPRRPEHLPGLPRLRPSPALPARPVPSRRPRPRRRRSDRRPHRRGRPQRRPPRHGRDRPDGAGRLQRRR